MSLPIIINPHHVWQLIGHDLIHRDTVYIDCHYHLARRLRQAFFMEISYEYSPTCPTIGV